MIDAFHFITAISLLGTAIILLSSNFLALKNAKKLRVKRARLTPKDRLGITVAYACMFMVAGAENAIEVSGSMHGVIGFAVPAIRAAASCYVFFLTLVMRNKVLIGLFN